MRSLSHYIQAIQSRTAALINARRGFKTNRKIVVFESDDWGTIRMPSKEVFDKMTKLGLDTVGNPYNTNDSLATSEDLSALFNVLSMYKDKNGVSPKITANTCMVNPDFEKIKASNYTEYLYEPFTKTLERYPNCSFESWNEGIIAGIFVPQLHCREHLNVERWMKELQNGNKELLQAFELGTWGNRFNNLTESVVQGLIVNDENSLASQEQSLIEAMQLFETIFGFTSKSFIAPCYTWNPEINPILKRLGVEYLQGTYIQHTSSKGVATGRINHYMGEMNKEGQIYLTRNAYFEPTSNPQMGADACLKNIEQAFRLNKPAVISTHRLNFIGAIRPENRDNNLRAFSSLLQSIVKRWPDVEFMSSDELGDLIREEQNKG